MVLPTQQTVHDERVRRLLVKASPTGPGLSGIGAPSRHRRAIVCIRPRPLPQVAGGFVLSCDEPTCLRRGSPADWWTSRPRTTTQGLNEIVFHSVMNSRAAFPCSRDPDELLFIPPNGA